MKEYKTDNLSLFHMDNMELMKQYEDNHFDLAIVDPPYGIGEKFKGGKNGKMQFNEIVEKGWDNAPDKEYFDELFRVSKNQIIWGGNYFELPATRCVICWDKLISEDFSLAMLELAWTSFDKLAKIFRMSTPKDGKKIHNCQKPVALYQWLLKNYAKPNDKILDTHLGSGSIAVACENGIIIDNETVKFNLTGCELDEEYFDNMCKRIEAETQQQSLF